MTVAPVPRLVLQGLTLAFTLAGITPGAFAQDDPAVTRAQEILLPFKQNLMQALQSGMQQGPVAALDACRIQAPAIAAAISTDGIRVGRTSHKLRNPGNTSPAWAQDLLQAYVDDPDNRQPHTVPLEDGRTGYVEPIIVQPLCLACHGENLDSAVTGKLHELYPSDQATGFSAGDFRGVFWAEFPSR